MEFYAHKREMPDGAIVTQTVREHLVGTAQRAAQCLRQVGLEHAGYLAGLLHDLGKYTEAFQQYLDEGDSTKRGSVIHTFQGCRYLMEQYHRGDIQTISCAELLAFAVGAHHGLFDCVDQMRRIGLQYRAEKQDIFYEEAVAAFRQEIPTEEIETLFAAASEEINEVIGRMDRTYDNDREYAFETGLLARLLLSAVIEGDRCDTAAFQIDAHPRVWPEDMAPIWKDRLEYLEEKLQGFPCGTPVEKARHAISDQCRVFAENKPGIYRLNVPTGGGKTLSSLRYALAHAMYFRKSRLIFTSPLLSILEQNAAVIHQYVGDDSLILEHHSNVVQTEPAQGELDERELLVQSWNAPIIITTLVQLLNTLFDGRTTAIRRFQALCSSVIVIDEVQTVPVKMLTLFNLALRFLSEQCGATIVLCSATQPELKDAAHPLPVQPQEIVPWDAATTGRLAVTYYNEITLRTFLERIHDWDAHCCWLAGNYGIQAPNLLQLVDCAFGTQRNNFLETDDRIQRQHLQRLLNCKMNGGIFPLDILKALTQRASSPLAYDVLNWRKIVHAACAVLQKYRYDTKQGGNEMAWELDTNNRSFQYGRLLAVMERAEMDYYTKTNENRQTNAIKFMSEFRRRPFTVFERVNRQLERAYLDRIDAWQVRRYKQLVGEIINILRGFPENELNRQLEDLYLMGYELQRNAFFTKNDTTNHTEEE